VDPSLKRANMRSQELQHQPHRIGDFGRSYGLYYAGFLLVLLLLYSSAIIAHFGYHDDFYYFTLDDHRSFRSHPQFEVVMVIGRELYAVLAAPMAWFVRGIADFSLVRVVYVAFLAVAALLLVRMLVRLGMERWCALCLALAICLLPGCEMGVLWVSMAPFIGAMILSLLAAALAVAAEVDNLFDARRQAPALAGVGAAILCLLAALFTYPPWAMFFLVPVFAYVLLETPRGVKYIFGKLVVSGFVFLCATVLYFSLQKVVFEPVFRRMISYAVLEQSPYKFAISADIPAKTSEFVEALTESLNLWNIYPSQVVAGLVAIVIFLGALASLRLLRAGMSIGEWMLRAVTLLLLLPAALLPNLAAAANSTPYRVMVPLAAMLTIAAYASINFGVMRLPLGETARSRLRVGAVAILTLTAAGVAFFNVAMSSTNSALEFRLLQSFISEHVARGETLNRVHVVLLNQSESLLGLPSRYDEFNCNTLSAWQDVPWMLRAALLELGVPRAIAHVYAIALDDTGPIPAEARLVVTTAAAGDEYRPPQGTIVFDFNEFAKPSPATVTEHCCNFKAREMENVHSVAPGSNRSD